MRARLDQIVVDVLDPASLVRFWSALLGGTPVDREHGCRTCGRREPAERLGAVRVGGLVVDEQGSFQVLRDPEGNEFCFVHG